MKVIDFAFWWLELRRKICRTSLELEDILSAAHLKLLVHEIDLHELLLLEIFLCLILFVGP